METITNMTQAASRAIWGTPSTQEPVSGKTGDVSKGEPYDAGNMDPPEHVEDAYPQTPNEPAKNKPNDSLPTSEQVEDSMLNTATTKKSDNKPDSSGVPDVNPQKLKPSSTPRGDATAAQNDVRDPSDPSTQHHEETLHYQKNNVDDSNGGLDQNENPEKLKGPGPRPVAEIAKEMGGDAGRASASRSRDADSSSGASSSEDSLKKGETEEDPKNEAGKGMLYVRSSGLRADGGDFDATKPGAGREADRLLEEKGVKRDPSGGITGNLPDTPNGGGKEGKKHRLKEKIKAKLHKAGPV